MKADRYLYTLFLASVFLLACNQISDTDVWIHLSQGKMLWQLRGFPAREPFVFRGSQDPYLYSSWLFGVLIYLIQSLFSDHGLVLFQALMVTASFHLAAREADPSRSYPAVTFLLLPLAVMVSQYRFVIRPDLVMMLFLALTIRLLRTHRENRSRSVYFLPVVACLWANSHASLPLMLVPFFAFMGGMVLNRLLPGRRSGADAREEGTQLRTLAALCGASLVAALANPYGYRQFFNGSSLLGSAYVKQEVIELMPLVPQQKLWLGLVVAIIALSLVLNRRKLSLADLLLVLPFIYLSCTARRFVFLAAFVGIPVAIRNFTSYLDHRGWQERCRSRWLAGGVGCWLVLYTVLTLAHILPLETTNFGTGFSYDQTPRGGVDYLDRNRIFGKVFNTPVFGQYILWTSYPHRTVIADARFHGDGRLLQRLDDALFSDDVLDGLYRDYGFEVLLVKSAEISRGGLLKDSSLQFNHPRWALVYWDDTSMVYLRRTEAFAAIIARDEYRVVKPYLTISGFNRQLGTTVDTGGLVRELSDNIRRTGSGLAYLYLGLLHSKGGRYDQALACFTRTRDYGGIRDYMLAETYRNMGDYDNSLRHYRQSLQSAGSSYAYLGLGSEYFRRGDHRKAEDALKKAVAMDGSGERGYVLLEQLYRQRGDEVHAREIAATLARVRMVNRGKQLFGIGIRHYLAKEYDQAVTAFTSSLEYDSGNATTMVNLGFCYLDLGDYGKARDNFEKAVAVDAKQANAYYGLALIDKAQGRREQAAGNFARYIRLMPQGKYSRKAGEELRSLQGK